MESGAGGDTISVTEDTPAEDAVVLWFVNPIWAEMSIIVPYARKNG